MAAQERVTITQHTLAGKKGKAGVGGPAPLGYRHDKEGGLVIVPEEAEIVQRIYSLREQRHTLEQIADVLNAEGVPTKSGGRWYPATVRYIFDNLKYQSYGEDVSVKS